MSRVFRGCPVPIVRFFALLAVLAGPALAAAAPANPVGDWMTEDHKGVITIAPCGDALCGAITGLSEFPPGGRRDVHGAQECQLQIIKDMRPGDDGRHHGTVDNPENGKVYHAQLWVDDAGVLNLRGYVGIPLLGETRNWTKFVGKRAPDCHFSAG